MAPTQPRVLQLSRGSPNYPNNDTICSAGARCHAAWKTPITELGRVHQRLRCFALLWSFRSRIYGSTRSHESHGSASLSDLPDGSLHSTSLLPSDGG